MVNKNWAAEDLLSPSSSWLGVNWGRVALSWFPDGPGGGAPGGGKPDTLSKEAWPAIVAFVSLCDYLSISRSVSVSGSVSVSVQCSPPPHDRLGG